MVQHPDLELSLYLDDALAPQERRAIEAHLAVCEQCRARLGELRSVARLVASLPERAPQRSLLPRRSALPGWLVPARWASSLAAGVFVLVFVVANLSSGGLHLATPAAAPAAPAPASSGANDASSNAKAVSSSPQSAFGAAASAAPSVPLDRVPAAATTPASERGVATDRATVQARGSVAPTEPVATSLSDEGAQPPLWLWLVPAVFFALVALGLQYRIARAKASRS
jgi:anti-sigma factor RsiW